MTLTTLRALALKATPGRWEAVLIDDPRGQPVPYYRGLICTVEHGERYLSVVTADGSGTAREQWESNCKLIAACSPETVLALVKVAEAARALDRSDETWADLQEALSAIPQEEST